MLKIKNLLFLSIPTGVSILFIYLFYLEYFNYDNYVFANLHINLYKFAFIPGVFWAIWSIYRQWHSKPEIITKVLIVLFCLVTVPSGIQSVGEVAARTHQMILGKSYVVQKSKTTFMGNDYKFIEFVKRYLSTYKDVVITLPPNELPWRHTGNPQIMNSFLYPISTTSKYNGSMYVLISSEEDGASYHLWPDFKMPAQTIIIYDWINDKAVTITGENWDPAEWQDKKPWGLIINRKINE